MTGSFVSAGRQREGSAGGGGDADGPEFGSEFFSGVGGDEISLEILVVNSADSFCFGPLKNCFTFGAFHEGEVLDLMAAGFAKAGVFRTGHVLPELWALEGEGGGLFRAWC